MGKVLVLGAEGFIGSCLVSELVKNYEVVGYDRLLVSNKMELENYHYVSGNFTEEQNFSRILRANDISAIYHLISTTTPKVGTSQIEQEIESNILPTIRLLDAAAECGVNKIIFSSSGGTVYGDNPKTHSEDETLAPICSYGTQKMVIEGYLRLYSHIHNLSVRIARIGNPYGSLMRKGQTQGIIPIFLQKLHSNEGITVYGNTMRDYIHISDVIRALVLLLQYKGSEQVFNIASGKGTYINDLIRMLEDVSGKKFTSIQYEDIRSCDVPENVLDISLAKKELSWEPRISLREGIKRTIDLV